MSYPPQGQPFDPNQTPQPQQPPGGRLPGQGPMPQYGQDPYGGYTPPPVPPNQKSNTGMVVLILVVVLLMAAGGVAGYVFLGDDPEQGTTTAGEEQTTEAADEPSEESSEEGTEEETEEPPEDFEIPDGYLGVESLGALTPDPGAPWEVYTGPGGYDDFSTDTHADYISLTDDWIAVFSVGLFSSIDVVYDPSDLAGTAEATMESYAYGSAFDSTDGLTLGQIELTEQTIDGRPGILAEATVTWDSSDNTTDTYEDIALLIVDVDGVNGFIGRAGIPESAIDSYDASVDALLATAFN